MKRLRDVRATAALPVRIEPDVTLVLSAEVARTLFAVTRAIGGSPHSTYRGDTDAILVALEEAGVSLERRFTGSLMAADCADDE